MKLQYKNAAAVLIIFAPLVLASCMSVDMFSQRNPQWHGQPLKE